MRVHTLESAGGDGGNHPHIKDQSGSLEPIRAFDCPSFHTYAPGLDPGVFLP